MYFPWFNLVAVYFCKVLLVACLYGMSLFSCVCSSSRGWMMAAVLQLSVVRSILFFVTLVLWTDEQYDYGDVSQ